MIVQTECICGCGWKFSGYDKLAIFKKKIHEKEGHRVFISGKGRCMCGKNIYLDHLENKCSCGRGYNLNGKYLGKVPTSKKDLWELYWESNLD